MVLVKPSIRRETSWYGPLRGKSVGFEEEGEDWDGPSASCLKVIWERRRESTS